MKFNIALSSLFDLCRHTNNKLGNRYVLTTSHCLAVLLLVWMPSGAWAQVGRQYVSVEAYVGLARAVHVGKIVELTRIDYEKPLTGIQKFGKPYRMVFEVSETIRGDKTERLELVLALQITDFLDYMLEHSLEVMLVAGPNQIDRFPNAEIGIEEQGKRLDAESYQFRLLTTLSVPNSDGEDSIASALNNQYDSCRMFTNDFEIVEGREMILKRARDFAKEHTEMLSAVSISVPNEFGALCGSPAAFSHITFPMCPSTKKSLAAVKDDLR